MDSNKAISKYKKLLSDSSMYKLTGDMEIVSNEEVYDYPVTVDYMEGDYYKVTLENRDSEHKQIILKNENGVFVVTPSLNKSFKFQSEWPDNGSQAYLLNSLVNDINNDSESKAEAEYCPCNKYCTIVTKLLL